MNEWQTIFVKAVLQGIGFGIGAMVILQIYIALAIWLG